ncbi:Nucleotidyltransferase [Rickenella mellea]|uniref:polynucleotide adenylyltransferase n=1 Tax=Rickenella mellea TaxID=50990 RepID=A0A4Y7QHN9_9AGAM|nr:Nucleotidyltransferase [Rickenella mellea]
MVSKALFLLLLWWLVLLGLALRWRWGRTGIVCRLFRYFRATLLPITECRKSTHVESAAGSVGNYTPAGGCCARVIGGLDEVMAVAVIVRDRHNANSRKRCVMEGKKSLLERISPAIPVDKFEAFRRDNTYSQKPRKGKERAEEVIVEANDLPAHTPWCNGLDVKVTQSKELILDQEIAAFVKYVSPTPQEHQVRVLLSSYLTYVVKRRWTDATVTIFGSAAFDLYLPGGDIDMVLNFPYPISDKQRKTMLFQLSSTFKRERVAEDVEVRTHAKVPIMTCKTTPEFGNIGIDLSINGEDGIKAIPIVKSYLNKLPALRPLVLVVKRFLSQRNLNSAASGSLSSYSIVCMCISFLQLNPMELDSAAIENIDDSHSLGTLLLNFFDYYGNKFPYSTSYISVTKEKLLPKEEDGFLLESHPDLLAIECLVTSGIIHVSVGKKDPKWSAGKDISRGAGKVRQIKAAFQEAYTALNDAALVFPFESLLGQILKMSQNVNFQHSQRDLKDRHCKVLTSLATRDTTVVKAAKWEGS